MKIIIAPKRRDYFRLEKSWFSRSSLIHFETQIYNPLTIIILSNLLISIIGFFKPQLFAIPLTSFLCISFLYFKLRHMANFIELQRVSEPHGIEGKELKVQYIVQNYSMFKLTNVLLREKFDGTNYKRLSLNTGKSVSSKRKRKITINYPLNEGFGEKVFSELTLLLSDPIGLFTFQVVFDSKVKVIIYPDIQHMTEHLVRNNDDSYLSGDYEVFKKGVSPNFYGIKPYQYGDPVKNINWKVSRKINELVVNEFENAVNLNVHYIMNFNEDCHMGYGVNSTWEYCRDMALALLKNEVEKNHFFDIYSNDLTTELGAGKHHFDLLEIKMCYLKPISSNENLIKNSLFRVPKGHALVYIAPYVNSGSLHIDLRTLKENSNHFSDIHIYLIDPFDISYRMVVDHYKSDILRRQDETKKSIDQELNDLKQIGANISISQIKNPHKLIRQTKLWGMNDL